MGYSKEEVIEFLKSQKGYFATEFSVSKLGIFGSYARGEVRPESDLDIVVELDKPDLFSLIGVKQSIEEVLSVRVDVVRVRKSMNQVLKRRIEKDVIYV